MKQSRLAIFGLVSALFATTAFNSIASAQAAPATHIGVVNLQKVYTTIQMTSDWQKHLQGLQGELKTMQDAHQSDLKMASDKIGSTLKPGTDGYQQAMNELDTKSLQDSLDEKTMQVKMAREANRTLKSTFDQIQTVVADTAKKDGLDLVLVASNPELPNTATDGMDFEHLAQALFSRKVLYVSDKTDITAEVIAQLDAAYKAKK